jgi:2-aminomuconate deaminase
MAMSAKAMLKQEGRNTATNNDRAAAPRDPDASNAGPLLRRAGPFVFFSGTGGRKLDDTIAGADFDDFDTVKIDIRAQTRACVENVRDILFAAGGGLEHLVEVTTYLVNMSDFEGYNEIYGQYFSHQGPARTTVAVNQLPHPHMLIEMRGVAYIAEDESASKQNGAPKNGQG